MRRVTLATLIALLTMITGCATTTERPEAVNLTPVEFAQEKLTARQHHSSNIRKQKARQAFTCVEGDDEINIEDIPALEIAFIESDIREALLELSMLTEIPIVADESVQGIVSATLQSTSVKTALEVILAPGNFAYKRFPEFIFVGSQYPGSPSLPLLSTTCRFSPEHTQVQDLTAMLNPMDQQYVSVDEKSNLIAISAPPAALKKLRRKLSLLDKPLDQVLLEVSIVEVNREVFDLLGVNWGNLNIIEQGLDIALTNELFESISGDGQYNYNSIGSTRISNNMTRFKDSIGVLKSRGDADVKAMPSILTLDGKEAQFNSTETIWLPGFAEQSGKTKGLTYGVNVKLVPHVRSDTDIRLDIVDASVSDLASSPSGEPILVSHSVSNSVEVSNGDVVVLGGLLQKKNRNMEAKVPGLSKIPGLKKLFSQDRTEVKETEVLIVIRPTIVG